MKKLFWIPHTAKKRAKTDSMKSAIETHGMNMFGDPSSCYAQHMFFLGNGRQVCADAGMPSGRQLERRCSPSERIKLSKTAERE